MSQMCENQSFVWLKMSEVIMYSRQTLTLTYSNTGLRACTHHHVWSSLIELLGFLQIDDAISVQVAKKLNSMFSSERTGP